jgi:ABC-type spermidine/putrescine transport system permease subunit II
MDRYLDWIPQWVVLAALATYFLVWWRIFSRTGHSGALGLLMVVPGVNMVLLLVLAFVRWPIEQELRARRRGRL